MGSQESAAGSGLPKTVCSFEGTGKKPPAVWVKVMPSWPLARLLPLNWSPHGASVCSLFEFSPVCFGRIYPTICSGVVQRSLPITLPFSSVNHMAPSPLQHSSTRTASQAAHPHSAFAPGLVGRLQSPGTYLLTPNQPC